MYRVNHTIAIDNEMTALADDFRGLGELVDVCEFHGVNVGAGIHQNLLTLFTDPTDYDTAVSIVKLVGEKAPVFPEVEEA